MDKPFFANPEQLEAAMPQGNLPYYFQTTKLLQSSPSSLMQLWRAGGSLYWSKGVFRRIPLKQLLLPFLPNAAVVAPSVGAKVFLDES